MSARDTFSNHVDEIRRRLDGKSGHAFWRSLEELSDTPEFQRLLAVEFPSIARSAAEFSRRDLLKCLGAALALAGLAGCSDEVQHTVPYVEAPENVIPGRPKYYATAALMGGFAQPVLGETHVGRPTKLEGNPDHPAVLGATDAFTQAAVLGLYDPDRSRAPRFNGRTTSWSAFDAAMVSLASRLDATDGEGFRLLTETITSPTLSRQVDEMMRRWPKARWHVHDPAGKDLRYEAARIAFGRPLEGRLRPERAEAVVSLDDDWLGPGPRQTMHGRGWARRREQSQRGQGECLLWVAEATPSLTGAMASERAVVPVRRMGDLVLALAVTFGASTEPMPDLTEAELGWFEGAAQALRTHHGRSLLTVGAQHDPGLQALALLVNARLGNLGKTLALAEPSVVLPPDGGRSLEALADDMRAGEVTSIAMIETNPVYTSPVDLAFGDLLRRVETRIHAGLHFDETAALCRWHVPTQHELESWGDARAADGLVTLLQPLIRPIFAGRSRYAVLQNLRGDIVSDDRVLVGETWRAAWGEAFDERWATALVRGFVPESAPPEVAVQPAVETLPRPEEVQPSEDLTVVFQPDPCIWDGRYANVAWLQELPKPLTKVTWDNVILVSPALAAEMKLATGSEVVLTLGERSVAGPAFVMPGQEERTLTVFLGYGRGPTGQVMDGLGYDAYRIRTSAAPWHASGARLTPTGKTWPLASTQLHFALDGRDLVRFVKRSELTPGQNPREKPEVGEKHNDTLYPVYAYDSPSWGMSIDTDLCIGCNACVVACVAENNIPMVGKEQVAKGREMLWLRVDRYYEGPPENPRTVFQPVPCMHCEKAPCEMGCPVNATTHSHDGLNQQIYNRCIGTRTCSSFCPYKVRRFNWFDFTGDDPPELQAVRNPDVTVRDRGVMEKCTYCVQRIRSAEITAKIEGRPIHDGEVRTACQQACPTNAIVFGDVKDPSTAVGLRKASMRDYSLLEEVNTWPRTTYLSRIEEELPIPEPSKG